MRWDTDPASSHGWLVPLAVIWLVWRRWQVSRDAIPDRVPARTVVTGCCSLLAGTLLYLYLLPALSPASTLFPAGLGFVVAVLGLLLVVAGPDVGRVYLPPCLLLFFMVPLPFAAQQPVAESLQQTVAWTSETAIWLLGHPVYREGYILHLADTVLEVAAGCSGLGQFMVFVAIGAFCGVYSGNTRQGVILVALALPVSVLANTMRITMTALIHIYLGAAWAEGVLHEAEGLVTALIGAGLLFGAAGMLNRWTGGSSDAVDADDEPGTTDAAARLSEPVAARNSGLGIPQRAGLVISLLLPSLMLSQTIQLAAAGYRRPPVALSMPLGEFPTQLGSWTGRDVAVNREYFLYGDAHLNRVYINAETGQSVTLWMVYTTDGRDRGHHPQACMRAIGCQEVPERNATVALPGDGAAAKRFYFQDPADGSGRWVSYWYHVFDTGERQQRTDLLKHLAPPPSRRSGLTAQIFATELTPADAIAADEFATLVEQALQASTLPENTRRDHRRGSYLMTADLTTR
jgi:exosortase